MPDVSPDVSFPLQECRNEPVIKYNIGGNFKIYVTLMSRKMSPR